MPKITPNQVHVSSLTFIRFISKDINMGKYCSCSPESSSVYLSLSFPCLSYCIPAFRNLRALSLSLSLSSFPPLPSSSTHCHHLLPLTLQEGTPPKQCCHASLIWINVPASMFDDSLRGGDMREIRLNVMAWTSVTPCLPAGGVDIIGMPAFLPAEVLGAMPLKNSTSTDLDKAVMTISMNLNIDENWRRPCYQS